jgi:hypothetical protein
VSRRAVGGVLFLLLLAFPRVTCGDAAPVRVKASVDRTAIWVADRVTYTIDIVCSRGVDVLLDDLAKEKLRVNGFDIVSSDASVTTDASEQTRHRLRYVLTTYRFDMPSLSIEPLSVRYYARRPGQRLQDVAPAGEVQIPGATVAFRSTLPEKQPSVALRDAREPASRNPVLARIGQIGLALVVMSLAPAAFVAAATMRRRTSGRPARKSARQARLDQRATLERLRSLDLERESQRRLAYDEISAAVRQHLAAQAHLPATALTAEEIEAALGTAPGRVAPESIGALLAAADGARYSPPEALPSIQACRDALSAAEQLLGTR